MPFISEISTTAPKKGTNATKDKVFALLDKLHIPYERVENDVVETMEECKEIDQALGTEIRKSIFLCNQKKTSFFLVVMRKAAGYRRAGEEAGSISSVLRIWRADGEASWHKARVSINYGIDQ